MSLPVEKHQAGDIMATLEKPKEDSEGQFLGNAQKKPNATVTLGEIVAEALQNPKYVWRTVEGIARETKLPPGDVLYALESDLSDSVVRSSIPDRKGRSLYATRDRYLKRRSVVNRVLSVLSDEIR